MGSLGDWPEPVVCVQSLSENCDLVIPDQYIKPPLERPSLCLSDTNINIPVIDLVGLVTSREATMKLISEACREWGFFQLVNHGMRTELVDGAREVWREFFHESMEVKQKYANSPKTYEGFGSRLGVEKGAILDWSDYYYLNHLPFGHTKWPSQPPSLRKVMEEYSNEIVRLGEVLLKIFSINLQLKEDCLGNAFGGSDVGGCLRANFYPKCPQPDLTLGLSSHSDPGGITFLLPDNQVCGLQIRKDHHWLTITPAAPHAIIVNIGDQLQVLSNAIYKSVEHRVVVNSDKERVSLAYFYNPKSDLLIQPISHLLTSKTPALYPPMTFHEYRRFIRTKGPRGKCQLESSTL